MKTKLPKKGTAQAQMLVDTYLKYSEYNLSTLAEKTGYSRRDSFKRAMRNIYGITRPKGQINNVEPPPIIVPEIKILKYEPKGQGGPETQVLVLGDWHMGEITPTFNPEIAGKRLDMLFQSTMRITELHRNIYPVNDLVVFVVGDMTHGENPYQGAKVGNIVQGAVDQVFDLAFPCLTSLLCSLRENFLTVRAVCVTGNHGRISREAPETSNFDMVLYKALAQTKLPEGITVELPGNDFCQIVNVCGYKFFVHHGDAVRMTNGIPYFAQTRKAMSWYITYGGFSYIIQGHIHKDDYYRLSSKTKQITNGALVSDDPYALETIGTSTIPSQTTFGVHEGKGLTWYYSLTVDPAYFPEVVK